MIKRTVKYEDFNGVSQTKELRFHLSKSDLIEMEVEHEDGFAEHVQRIVDAENRKGLIHEFKDLLLRSYGELTADGQGFTKSEELRDAFKNSAAYSALFLELATDEGAAAAFINGVVPSDLRKEQEQDQPVGPPPRPASVMPPPVSQ